MNWIKKLLRPYTFEGKVEKVLSYPLLTFHYQSRATQTDLVHVYRPLTGELVLSYQWIDGEEAGPFHPLRKLHERFKTYTAQQTAVAERLRAKVRSNDPVVSTPQLRRFTAVPVPPPRDFGRRVDSNDLGPDLLMTSMLASMITPAPAAEPEKECRAETFRSGEGGDFGGAGATGSWEAPPPPAPAPSSPYSSSSDNFSSDSGSSSSGGGGGD